MFYSNFIFVKKGPLSKVWLAAHWHRKLTKSHVDATDISISAKSVLDPKTPLALRLSGQLLLGLARIYQKKVIFVLEDARKLWDDIHEPDFRFLPMPPVPKPRVQDITLEIVESEFVVPEMPIGMDLDRFLKGDTDYNQNYSQDPRLSLPRGRDPNLLPEDPPFTPSTEDPLMFTLDPMEPEVLVNFDEIQKNLEKLFGDVPMPSQDEVEVPRDKVEPGPDSSVHGDDVHQLDVDDPNEVNKSRMSVIPDYVSVHSANSEDNTVILPEPQAGPTDVKDDTPTLPTEPSTVPVLPPNDTTVPNEIDNKKKKRKRVEKPDENTELSESHNEDTSDLVLTAHNTLIFSKKQKFRHERRGHLHSLLEEPGLGWHHFDSTPMLLPPPLPEELKELFKRTMTTGLPNLPLKPKPQARKPEENEVKIPEVKLSEEPDHPDLPTDPEAFLPAPQLDIEIPDDISSLPSTPEKKTPEKQDLPAEELSRRKKDELERMLFFEQDDEEVKRGAEVTRRTKKMLTLLSNEMKTTTSLPFSKIIEGQTRQTSAAIFYQLLILKTHSFIHLQQQTPYGEIVITKDENFSRSLQI